LTLGESAPVNNLLLREELNQVLAKENSDAELKEQIQLIDDLRAQQPHSITLLRETVPNVLPRFNCYQYAFGLENVTLTTGFLREIRPGRDFMHSLMHHLLEEISLEDTKSGDHVLYEDSRIEHAGKMNAGAVESKWGLGHLWRHGLYELPLKYGNRARFFRSISPEDALAAFLAYHPGGRIE
jgi:hypothetical protein